MSEDDARLLHRGSGGSMSIRKAYANQGKPHAVVGDDQPDAREGQAGRHGVAERLVVPMKPGNAGGGKGPQFKMNATRGEGPGDWATLYGVCCVKGIWLCLFRFCFLQQGRRIIG
jgi:hypothetical protein